MHINEIGNSVDHTPNAQNSGYTHMTKKYVNNSRTIKQEWRSISIARMTCKVMDAPTLAAGV